MTSLSSSQSTKDDELIFKESDHTYWVAGNRVPGVTEILNDEGIIDKRFYTEEGRERGKTVHLILQYLDEGTLNFDSVDKRLLGYIQAYLKFKEQTGFEPSRIEEHLYNPIFGLAGTLDREGTMKIFNHPWRVLVEIKTGTVAPWAVLQTAGYDLILPPAPRKRVVVELNDTGTYKLHWFADRTDKQVFLSLMGARQWKIRNLKKGGNST